MDGSVAPDVVALFRPKSSGVPVVLLVTAVDNNAPVQPRGVSGGRAVGQLKVAAMMVVGVVLQETSFGSRVSIRERHINGCKMPLKVPVIAIRSGNTTATRTSSPITPTYNIGASVSGGGWSQGGELFL